jgi:hypothetical protein
MISLFKVLVVLSYAIYVVFFWLPEFDFYIYDQDTIDILSWSGFGALLAPNNLIGYLFFVGYSVILIGLLLFKNWARLSFVVITIASVLFTAIQGIQVMPAIEATIQYITTLIDGATIAIMYLTSVGQRFNKNA